MTAPVYNRIRRELAIGEEFPIAQVGNLASLLSATGDMEIAFDGGSLIPFEAGTTMSFEQEEEFGEVRIKNTSGALNEIDLYIARGDFFDLRFKSAGTLIVENKRPDVFTEHPQDLIPFETAPSVLPAKAKRKEALFVNTGDVDLWIKSTNGTTLAGSKLAPGQPFVVEHTAEVFAYNPHVSTDGYLSISETEFS